MQIIATPFSAIVACCVMALLFVGTLYVIPGNVRSLPRSHPMHIQWRMLCTLASSSLAVIVVFLFAEPMSGPRIEVWLSLPGTGFLQAATLPLLLTASLFAGPMLQAALQLSVDRMRGKSTWHSLYPEGTSWRITVRNLVAAPVAEEMVFRACMCAVLIGAGFTATQMALLAPCFFAIAHLHHAYELRRQGYSTKQVLMSLVAQLAVTSLFGAYAVFLLLRTGHVIAPILSHMFCNFFGAPSLAFMNSYHDLYPKRKLLLVTHVVGIIAFALLISPATTPSLYAPQLWSMISA